MCLFFYLLFVFYWFFLFVLCLVGGCEWKCGWWRSSYLQRRELLPSLAHCYYVFVFYLLFFLYVFFVCSLLGGWLWVKMWLVTKFLFAEKGVVAIFGPLSKSSSEHIRSITDRSTSFHHQKFYRNFIDSIFFGSNNNFFPFQHGDSLYRDKMELSWAKHDRWVQNMVFCNVCMVFYILPPKKQLSTMGDEHSPSSAGGYKLHCPRWPPPLMKVKSLKSQKSLFPSAVEMGRSCNAAWFHHELKTAPLPQHGLFQGCSLHDFGPI